MKPDSRVDQYIAKAPPFAQPILSEVRRRVQQACPAAAETIKWNVPFYLLDGKLLASMAAFKKHLKVGVWTDGKGEFVDVTSLAELPDAKEQIKKIQSASKLITNAAPTAQGTPKKTTKKAVAKSVSKQTVAKPKPVAEQAGKKATAKKKAAAKAR